MKVNPFLICSKDYKIVMLVEWFILQHEWLKVIKKYKQNFKNSPHQHQFYDRLPRSYPHSAGTWPLLVWSTNENNCFTSIKAIIL